MIKSLKARQHELSATQAQLELLEQHEDVGIASFKERIDPIGLYPLKPNLLHTLQINLGKMCNQTCKHCHVDAGPDRKEIMTRETMEACLLAIDKGDFKTVDLTGGAPEMNPDFRWFVSKLYEKGVKVIVRSNLTIIVANKKYHDLPTFYKEHEVEVISSLPYFSARRTDAQRGEGVFDKSIRALKLLNEVGYGMEGSGLKLHLVYNPTGAFLPGNQQSLEDEFKKKLHKGWGISFNELYTITNLPISRFLEYLLASGNYEGYMHKLAESFNPQAAENVMCRNTLSVGWEGSLYDCDFNQMLELEVDAESRNIRDFNPEELAQREIQISQHCFGCTAGAGSSCGGSLA